MAYKTSDNIMALVAPFINDETALILNDMLVEMDTGIDTDLSYDEGYSAGYTDGLADGECYE